MPKGGGVASWETQEAAGDKRPLETPAATGSGALARLGSATATPSPMSPRRYQPLNSSSEVAGTGKVGAGGKSTASAILPLATATARACNLAITAFGPGRARR